MEDEKTSGTLHPVTTFIYRAYGIFRKMGFTVAEGPQMESEYNNFDALNVPPDHPSRDQQDTFWIKNPSDERALLRSHTSSVQARYMLENKPPFRIISPGRVYRQEATDATHEIQFHQIEGLVVEKGINLGNLKAILERFLKDIFEDESLGIRFRPGYFPFVEPGVEIDVSCAFCKAKGCRICKGTGWIEILGAGMVHPNVFNAVSIDSEKWRGIAFGLNPERILMLKHGIDDIRWFHSADLRFLKQF
ncbi:MAG: phenylalanine--tRNA ligase subunit alpha [Candidatus Paceibacterota bacterium]